MKSELRKTLLARRKALTESEVKKRSAAIFRRWQPMLCPEKHRAVHIFLSIQAFREVDTKPFICHLQAYPKIQIGVPRVDCKSREVTHHPFVENDLIKSSWGILEPSEQAPRIEPEVFDMVLVPMLAFDRSGHRVGYGGGYYDRFLAQVRPDCLRIGLCFDLGFIESGLPSGSHDIALDGVITESRFVKVD